MTTFSASPEKVALGQRVVKFSLILSATVLALIKIDLLVQEKILKNFQCIVTVLQLSSLRESRCPTNHVRMICAKFG
jgi:hypothetical protein